MLLEQHQEESIRWDDGQAAEQRDEQGGCAQRQWSDFDNSIVLDVGSPVPHGIRYHGREEHAHDATETLESSEVTAGRPTDDREPQVIVKESLASVVEEELTEASYFVSAGHRYDSVDLTVSLVDGKPLATQEVVPRTSIMAV